LILKFKIKPAYPHGLAGKMILKLCKISAAAAVDNKQIHNSPP
jgi:hypothetical protein